MLRPGNKTYALVHYLSANPLVAAMWTQIATDISQAIGADFQATDRRSVSGGCINQGYALSNGNQQYFVKLNQASQISMFEAEALGLQQMRSTATLQIPAPICWGVAAESAYLVLEWLDLGQGTPQAWRQMGHQLAAMHQVDWGDRFGWERANTIGSTLQPNPWTEHWSTFFTEQRLSYQFHLARKRGGQFPQQDQLLAAIPEILAGHQPQPSLVHGDLWSGNAAITRSGIPVIFDPATYVGDREVDVAMTELFGGFPVQFYAGYNDRWPLEAGYQQRKPLYNLYHILNHFNLFGSSYLSQANQVIQTLLRSTN